MLIMFFILKIKRCSCKITINYISFPFIILCYLSVHVRFFFAFYFFLFEYIMYVLNRHSEMKNSSKRTQRAYISRQTGFAVTS